MKSGMKWNQKINLPFLSAIGIMAMFIGGCSSKGSTKSSRSAKIGEPSPVDPKNPPKAVLSGIKEGLNLPKGSALEGTALIQNYPLKAYNQRGVIYLNGEPASVIIEEQQKFTLKEGFRDGENLISFVLERSWGETLKNSESIAQLIFGYGKKIELKNDQATILLASPRGTYAGDDAVKILFDYRVSGLKGKTPRIRYSLSGETREVAGFGPYFFQNLPAGSYQLKVWLVDNSGKQLNGNFTEASATFIIE